MNDRIESARKALKSADIARAEALGALQEARAAVGRDQAIAKAKAFTDRAALNRAAGLARAAEKTFESDVTEPSEDDLDLEAARAQLVEAKEAETAASAEWSRTIEVQRAAARATHEAQKRFAAAVAPVNRARAILTEVERARNRAKHPAGQGTTAK